MTRELISRRTRIEFREVLVDFVLREIEDFFAGAGLEANHEYDPGIGGERRSLVEQFYFNIDFTSPMDVKNVLAAYSDIVSGLEREHVDPLLRRLKQDGFILDADGRFKPIPGKHNPLAGTLDDLAKVPRNTRGSQSMWICWSTPLSPILRWPWVQPRKRSRQSVRRSSANVVWTQDKKPLVSWFV